jgi:peptide/nickel transport system substrate-binding protein
MRVEPPQIYDSAVDRSAIQRPLFTAGLGIWNLQENPEPVLAQAVPRLNTDSWRVFPDGRMETVYRLRPGLKWHDGRPLTAADFAITRRADVARVEWGLQQTSAEIRAMEDIVAPDPGTVVIRWREPFTEAPAPDILVHPRHILEAALAAGDSDAFGNHPFWTTEYVGLGPYRLERWERGAFVEGLAFDGYALGRPKIDRIRLTWNNDPNVSLTRLLAGDADIALDGAIRYEQAAILKTRWNAQQGDTILLNPTSLRYIQVQARPAYVSPQALLDARTRKALSHSIDRGALAETMLEDRNMVADTVPPPTAASYAAVERVLTKHPFDLRRAEQLMAEVGYTKGSDGVYVSPAQGRFQVEVRGVSGGQEEQDTTLVASFMREAGFDPQILLLPSSSRAVDDRMKGTFPGLTLNNNTLQRGLGLNKWLTSNIGGPHDNWVGGNRMGWSNPEFDRLYSLWTTSLDRVAATQHFAQMMKILNEELPSPPLYYNFQVVAHIGALKGPLPITPDSTRYGNVHQWEWRGL